MKSTQTYPSQKLINGQWGYTYDQAKRMVLGGYCADGKTFTHTFTVSEVAKKDVLFAVALCGLLYGEEGTVVMTYRELVGNDETAWRLFRYDVELHNK